MAVGRPFNLKYTKYGVLGGLGLGTGIAPLPAPPSSHHPGYTLPAPLLMHAVTQRSVHRAKVVVGLISVDQLTLRLRISDIEGMTEVYNLLRIGRINNH